MTVVTTTPDELDIINSHYLQVDEIGRIQNTNNTAVRSQQASNALEAATQAWCHTPIIPSQG